MNAFMDCTCKVVSEVLIRNRTDLCLKLSRTLHLCMLVNSGTAIDAFRIYCGSLQASTSCGGSCRARNRRTRRVDMRDVFERIPLTQPSRMFHAGRKSYMIEENEVSGSIIYQHCNYAFVLRFTPSFNQSGRKKICPNVVLMITASSAST
jgi:hypothetical protein